MTKQDAREIILRLSSEAEKAGEMEDMVAFWIWRGKHFLIQKDRIKFWFYHTYKI